MANEELTEADRVAIRCANRQAQTQDDADFLEKLMGW